MFREFVTLVNESVSEGIDRGTEMFLEGLNTDLEMDEIYENHDGIKGVLKKVFMEGGFEPTEEDENENGEPEDDEIEEKLDKILALLKKDGVVD